MRKLTLAVLLTACTLNIVAQQATVKPPKPYGALPTPSQLKWHEMEMYAFMHFTINTFTDKEWGFGDESPTLFNPTNFDAKAIASIFKQAGFKGMILTTKHHDGFCLWPTKTTEHNISKSPWRNGKGDMVKEFADACRDYNLKFGVYLSPWDRNNKYYGTPEYIKIYREQFRELLTNYGPIFETWHDGANGGDGYYGGAVEKRQIDKQTYYDWPNTWKMVEELQPDAVAFSDIGPGCRWVGNERGYAKDPCWSTITFETENPNEKPAPGIQFKNLESGTRNGKLWVPAEVNFSMRPGWFWHQSQNENVKTEAQLLEHYFLSVGRGANMLVNVPPDKRGRISEQDSLSLVKFGRLIQQLYSINYANGAKVSASNVRGNADEYSPKKVLDNDRYSYWATDDNVRSAELTLTLRKPATFNVIKLRENIKLGHRVNEWAVDIMENGVWREYAKGVAIGASRLIRGKKITTAKVRLRIINADANPCISEVGLYAEPETALQKVVNSTNFAVQKRDWKGVSPNEAKNLESAFDGNPVSIATFSEANNGRLTIDLGNEKSIVGFSYLPRQDGVADGIIDKYIFRVSTDGSRWKDVSAGEFANIRNNPINQTISFHFPVKARYIQLVATGTLKGAATVAEIGITPAR